ncbi:TetR/AcrR family transcriptional regulator [Gordonia spumicola]|uniref:TetR/AcrR family transcriptional regulator n=1 Tax=Gordonia spumicola TaxID=589161 RepID=UPI00137B5E78|nr:TetR/AcrR family transcriptional regulator [Gordonia spumicola]
MTTTSVRDRLLSSATLLLRSRGADGFGVAELLASSGVARRSMYQHFPDGKAEVLRVATAEAGKGVGALLKAMLDEMPALDALDVWVQQWIDLYVETDYAIGCPLAAASLSAPEYPAAAAEAAVAFRRFESLIADALVRDGLDAAEATTAAAVLVFGLEGAIVTARARRDIAPFRALADHARSVWGPRLA